MFASDQQFWVTQRWGSVSSVSWIKLREHRHWSRIANVFIQQNGCNMSSGMKLWLKNHCFSRRTSTVTVISTPRAPREYDISFWTAAALLATDDRNGAPEPESQNIRHPKSQNQNVKIQSTSGRNARDQKSRPSEVQGQWRASEPVSQWANEEPVSQFSSFQKEKEKLFQITEVRF